jgi:lysyl endopeptidase
VESFASGSPTFDFSWVYESDTCGGNHGQVRTTSGARIISRNAPSDFALLLLDRLPPAEWNIPFAGWDRTGQGITGTAVMAIHHPLGDQKKISRSNTETAFSTYSDLPNWASEYTHIRTVWAQGVTEPGSSGSPIFNANQRIIGQLHGGFSSCEPDGITAPDWYGALNASWTGGRVTQNSLSFWLDPLRTNIATLDALLPQNIPVTPPAVCSVADVLTCGSSVVGTTQGAAMRDMCGFPSPGVW